MNQYDNEKDTAASDFRLPAESVMQPPATAEIVAELEQPAITANPDLALVKSAEETGEFEPPIIADMEENSVLEAPVALALEPGKVRKKGSNSPFRDSLRRLRKDKRALVSLWVIVAYILIALIGPFIYQHIGSAYTSNVNGKVIPAGVYHGFSHQEPDRQDEGPSAQYWLGTDSIGRDLFGRLMQGMLVSVLVALAVEVVDVLLGITVGVLAGYYGGWIDQFLARFADIVFAFPGLLFAILLVGILGSKANQTLGSIPIIGPNGNARLLLVSIALAFTVWPLMARYVRGQTLQLKEQQFVEAARTSGTSDMGIIVRHIVPNLMSIVIISSTLNIVNTIIGEAGLSLLGLGVQIPGSSLGLMISDGSNELSVHPWEALLPSAVLVIIVLAFSYLGDGLRDAFDPRSKD